MNYEEVLKDLNGITQVIEEFNEKHGKEIADFIVREHVSEEENLIINTLLSVTMKFNEIKSSVKKLQKPVKHEGLLSKNDSNQICLDNKPLPIFTELEVLIHDEVNHGWTSTIVGSRENGSYLAGIPRDANINGMKARMR